MALKTSYEKPIGVIGAGSFGTAIANILARNKKVLLYSRKSEAALEISKNRISSGQKLHEHVQPTDDLAYLARSCDIIFPVVPSSNFREMMQSIAVYLQPYHILIHGTKGFDISLTDKIKKNGLIEEPVSRENVKTMSEVIKEESVVVRVGCLAGPNLAIELSDNQPAGTVLASHFDEVISTGQNILRNDRFQVYGSSDLIGIELCGVLKNIIAIASGALSGLGLGENARALLISRGLVELIYLGNALGGNTKAFIGLAGVGDLVATCSSSLSRNFTVGYRLAKGETLTHIVSTMDETAEGINTIRITKKLTDFYSIKAPITETLYQLLFEGMETEEAMYHLMKYPFNIDVDFL